MLIIYTPGANARSGRVRTHDGKQVSGELSLTNGAVCVSNATEVTSIAATNVSEVNFLAEESPPPATERGQGIGLLGLYFANTNANSTVRLRIDPTVDFDWGVGEPIDGIGKDYFGVIWMGEVEAPGTGEFTFYLSADDGGRLQVGDQLYFNSTKKENASEAGATLPMEKGRRYKLMVFYFDYLGAARAKLAWSGPDLPRSLVPSDRLYPASYVTEHQAQITGTNGWLATYYRSNDFAGPSFTRIDPTLDVTTNAAARWRAQFQPTVSETVTFFALSDGDIKLKVNGKVLLQKTARELSESKATLPVTAGEVYDLEVESRSAGVTRLLWSSPSQSKALIPETCLVPYQAQRANLSATGPDLRLPAGVFFRNGSFVAGKVESGDTEAVQCSRMLAGKSIPARDLARIICQPVPQSLSAKLQPERPGVLLANGDFLEGEFRSLEGNRVQIDSVLFGLRTFDTAQQVLAIVLRPLESASGAYELHLKDQSIFSTETVEIEDGKLALTDRLLGKVSLPQADLVRLVKR